MRAVPATTDMATEPRPAGAAPVFEMETSGPDDVMTLLWLADPPDFERLGVLVTPGSKDPCPGQLWPRVRTGMTPGGIMTAEKRTSSRLSSSRLRENPARPMSPFSK